MKTKQLRIATMTFAEQPIQTSYMVTDYHNGYNTGKYYYKKYRVKLLSHVPNYYRLLVYYDKSCNDSCKARTYTSHKSMQECLVRANEYFKEHPQTTNLRIYK